MGSLGAGRQIGRSPSLGLIVNTLLGSGYRLPH